jgi:hypothetical protein
MGAAMTLVDRIDDFGRPGWIAITVLSFIIFWPIGFVVLGFLLGSGRMGCWHRYSNVNGEYREETLRRLEEEQREFLEFLDRLRHAKDKAEFDQFMAERRAYRDAPPSPPTA